MFIAYNFYRPPYSRNHGTAKKLKRNIMRLCGLKKILSHITDVFYAGICHVIIPFSIRDNIMKNNSSL